MVFLDDNEMLISNPQRMHLNSGPDHEYNTELNNYLFGSQSSKQHIFTRRLYRAPYRKIEIKTQANMRPGINKGDDGGNLEETMEKLWCTERFTESPEFRASEGAMDNTKPSKNETRRM